MLEASRGSVLTLALSHGKVHEGPDSPALASLAHKPNLLACSMHKETEACGVSAGLGASRLAQRHEFS